jgi:TnpA family transposase
MISEVNQFADSLGTTLESIESTIYRAEKIKNKEFRDKILEKLNPIRDALYEVEEMLNEWGEQ